MPATAAVAGASWCRHSSAKEEQPGAARRQGGPQRAGLRPARPLRRPVRPRSTPSPPPLRSPWRRSPSAPSRCRIPSWRALARPRAVQRTRTREAVRRAASPRVSSGAAWNATGMPACLREVVPAGARSRPLLVRHRESRTCRRRHVPARTGARSEFSVASKCRMKTSRLLVLAGFSLIT